LVLLEDQDRGLWDRDKIDEGLDLLDRAVRRRKPGPYLLQAAIAAIHAQAATAKETDWDEIAKLYSKLARIHPTPVVELNRAVAVAMARGPHAGLAIVQRLIDEGRLADYHLLHSIHADLLRRAGRPEEATAAFGRALELARQPSERAFLEKRMRELEETR
jgi:RNA polymerase sigma-70 factor (ECF subfamily)